MTIQPITSFSGTVLPLLRDNVDTDQIIPAAYLKVTNKEGLGRGLFANWRYLEDGAPDPDFVFNMPSRRGASILLAGHNFGCGSSREHAPWALVANGFRAVLAVGFADIFRRNALENGLLPIEVPEEQVHRLAEQVEQDPAQTVTVDLTTCTVTWPWGDGLSFQVDAFARRCMLEGVDSLGYLLSRGDSIEAYEAAHPAAFDSRQLGGEVEGSIFDETHHKAVLHIEGALV